MTYLAAGLDIPSWGGLLISALVALCGGLWFLFTQIKGGGSGGDGMVDLLKERIEDLERDLDEERRARAEEQRQNARDMEVLRDQFAQLRTELAVTRAQLEEAWRRGGKGQTT